MREYFRTKIETNAIIISGVLVPLQVFILWKINGQLSTILTGTCTDPLVIGTVFGPTIALVFTLRSFASKVEDHKNGHGNGGT